MVKTTIYTCVLGIVMAFQLQAQRKDRVWNNHENYKQEVIANMRNTPYGITTRRLATRIDKRALGNSTMELFKDFDFVNGINIAWVNFGRDIGLESDFGAIRTYRPDIEKFTKIFDKVSQSGGNVVRWWFHTNGSTSPVFDANDEFVVPNPDFFETDLRTLLDVAASKGLKIQICLWSFDMLKGGQWRVNSARNKKLLTSEPHLKAYLEHGLIPLVKALGNHPGLYAWELFNEPEGMTETYAGHWPDFTDKITVPELQRVVNKMAAAIRKEVPEAKITIGALGFLSSLNDSALNFENNYADAQLQQAGGEAEGYLDFYNIHYYGWAGEAGSPFHTTFEDSNLDKPAIIAEYYPDETFRVTPQYLGVKLLNNGWHGSLIWSWTDRDWEAIAPVLEATDSALRPDAFNAVPETLGTVSIFPNPATHQIEIKNIPKTTAVILLLNLQGQILNRFTGDFSMKSSLNVSLLTYSAGTYIISLQKADQTLHKRFVKL